MNLEENVVFLEVWTGSFLFQYSEMLGRFTGSVSSKYLFSTNHYLSIRFYAASDLSRNVITYSFGWVTGMQHLCLHKFVIRVTDIHIYLYVTWTVLNHILL
jgi:hypothetical protein